MRKYLKHFSLVVVLLSLTSCLQIETIIIVNKDGSGTIREKILMSETFTAMMKEFAAAFADPEAPAEEFSLYKEQDLIDDAGEYGDGVRYVESNPVKEKGWEGYLVTYSFDDITKIKLASSPDEKVDTGMPAGPPDLAEEEKEYYTFEFIPGNKSELIINRFDPTPKEEESTSQEDPDLPENPADDQFMKMMEDMSIMVGVEVNGKIDQTNATYVDGSQVTLLEMDFSKMMEDMSSFKEMMKTKPGNTDEMKAFIKKVKGIKLELEKPVSIKFN